MMRAFLLEDEAHRAERSKLMRLQEDAALFDFEARPIALENVACMADIFTHALIATIAMADEFRANRDIVAINSENTHIADHA